MEGNDLLDILLTYLVLDSKPYEHMPTAWTIIKTRLYKVKNIGSELSQYSFTIATGFLF